MSMNPIDKSSLYVDAGEKYEDEGNLQKAMDCYNNAIKLNKINYRAWEAKKELLFSVGANDEAFKVKQELADIQAADRYNL